MEDFISWAVLGTYSGALTMTLILTQFVKNIPYIKKHIPTQLTSYILAIIVLILAKAFTVGLSGDIIAQTFLNAVIVSIAANGAFGCVKKLTGKDTDGSLFIDTSNPEKDIYRLDVGSLDDLCDKKTITLAVKPGAHLSVDI